MNEKLKEFVEKYLEQMPIDPLSSDMERFAQAVADFTEKRVLEEVQGMGAPFGYQGRLYLAIDQEKFDQRLAALKGEKDGMA